MNKRNDLTEEPLPIAGIRLAAKDAQIYKTERDDLALIEIPVGATTACVFTQNAFCAAPVKVAKHHLRKSNPRLLLINAGNANAGTGDRGVMDAEKCCESVAAEMGCKTEEVLPFSTGVIGEYLPVENIIGKLPELGSALSAGNWPLVAASIMTTDTVAKMRSVEFMLDGEPVRITGIAKGSGMIQPNMATMLAYIATDAGISSDLLNTLLTEAVERSFNRISVDGDTSTNDSVVLIATAEGYTGITDQESGVYGTFQNKLDELLLALAHDIVKDGEGATKFVTVRVGSGASKRLCLDVAYDVANSPLVKTAIYAEDPNWGRIVGAIGSSREGQVDASSVSMSINDVSIVINGEINPSYTEDDGREAMRQTDIVISIDLGNGEHEECVWTCDLTHDYIRINAEYRS